jgi:hypothetical protein
MNGGTPLRAEGVINRLARSSILVFPRGSTVRGQAIAVFGGFLALD